MTLTKFEITNQLKLENLGVPFFEIDTRKAISLTKQLLRWFRAEIIHALAEQKRSIKIAPLYIAGQAYFCTLPDILDCEDTLGMEIFLESSKQRVLQIETRDPKFRAARINFLSSDNY